MLACTPLVDLAMLAFAIVDLRAGGAATIGHGLAAVYIGVSVAFGRPMMRWADERFAYRFAGGPAPSRPPKYGRAHARHERSGWYRHLVAWSIGCVLLLGGVVAVAGIDGVTSMVHGQRGGTGGLRQVMAFLGIAGLWTVMLVVDFAWSFSYTVWPRRSGSGTGSDAADVVSGS